MYGKSAAKRPTDDDKIDGSLEGIRYWEWFSHCWSSRLT